MKQTFLVLVLLVISVSTSTDWWKHASFYQIYPRSFKDSNNDGIGDLQGIIDKIDHFSDTGIDAIWLSPIFESPQVDQGYDISNYTKVDPVYGSNDLLKKLIDEAHGRNVKVILDFVPNHTSWNHSWFVDSENGVEEYRDYYVWVDGDKEKKPNNWVSAFKGSAWSWSEKRQQYYLHQFAAAQPDLNFRNEKVVEELKKVLRFWLDQGVDGFRIDAIPHLFEREDFPDEPLSNDPGARSTDYGYLNHIYSKDLPETVDMVYQWRQLVDEYTKEHGGDSRILLTEVYSDTQHTMLYFGTTDGTKLGAHFTFNFNLITDLDMNSTAQDIVKSVNRWLDNIPKIYTSNWVLGNHDQPRVATKYGPDNVDGFNMLKAILPGADVTYNGEEIGQENGEVSYEERQDPSAKNPASFNTTSRDFERTPFQWDDSVNAGFNTGAKPWLPVSKKYHETNLKKQKETLGLSHYKVYQGLVRIRKDPVLVSGSVKIKAVADYVVLVGRSYDNRSVVLIFNKGNDEAVVDVSEDVVSENKIEVKSVKSRRELKSAVDPRSLVLDPHEALILSC